MPSIQMIAIDLYTDDVYPRGLSILYKIDGYRTLSMTYMHEDLDIKNMQKKITTQLSEIIAGMVLAKFSMRILKFFTTEIQELEWN